MALLARYCRSVLSPISYQYSWPSNISNKGNFKKQIVTKKKVKVKLEVNVKEFRIE